MPDHISECAKYWQVPTKKKDLPAKPVHLLVAIQYLIYP